MASRFKDSESREISTTRIIFKCWESPIIFRGHIQDGASMIKRSDNCFKSPSRNPLLEKDLPTPALIPTGLREKKFHWVFTIIRQFFKSLDSCRWHILSRLKYGWLIQIFLYLGRTSLCFFKDCKVLLTINSVFTDRQLWSEVGICPLGGGCRNTFLDL